MGLAQADNLLAHPDRARRASAWHAIQGAWEAEQETVTAILNAINGWRNELGRQRQGRRLDALEVTCHQEHITGATLETLMAAAGEHRSWGAAPCGPWPVPSRSPTSPLGSLCPAPQAVHGKPGFEQALNLVMEAFAAFDPEMGAFVRMMADGGGLMPPR